MRTMSTLTSDLDEVRRPLTIAVVAINLAFPFVVLLSGLPEPWDAFYGEESAMNWFSSVQIAMLGVLALTVYTTSRLARSREVDRSPRSWPWALVGAGFLFLSLDEQFQTHERIRDEILKPAGILTGVPGLNAADIVLPLYALIGVAVTALIYRDLREQHRRSLLTFGAGLALILLLALQDSASLQVLERGWIAKARPIVEETGEVWAQMLFALALIGVAFEKLGRMLLPAQAVPECTDDSVDLVSVGGGTGRR